MNKQYLANRKYLLLLGDVTLVLMSAYLSFALRKWAYVDVLEHRTIATILFVSTYVMSFSILDAYNFSAPYKSTNYLTHFIFTVVGATAVLAILFYLLPFWKYGRSILLINMVLVSLFVYLWRVIFDNLFHVSHEKRNLVIIGAGRSGQHICNVIENSTNPYNIIGILDDDPRNQGKRIGSHIVLGPSNMLKRLMDGMTIHTIVVAIMNEQRSELMQILVSAKMNGVEIVGMPDIFEEITGKLPVDHMGDSWMAYASFQGVRTSIYTLYMKRILDILLALITLVFFFPIAVIIIVAIKLDSAGPVFYRQNRVGKNNKVFKLIKFRSMRADAEKSGAVWALENDVRVTRAGKFIRTARFDELPQIWNVLKGEMSFIGPRPERPEFVEMLSRDIPFYSFRHSVKPGITGWAQVKFRYGASKKDALDKLQYDLYYIKNLSAFLDLNIIIRTANVVLFRRGSR